jgi:hypothetical protein
MVTAARAKELLSVHGIVRPQPPDDWTGKFPLPTSVERFFQEGRCRFCRRGLC